MPDLCRFLSVTTIEAGDIGRPSYFQTTTCAEPYPAIASGYLTKGTDPSDTWTVDLKVPPVAGSVGQDWPAGCSTFTVPTDGADYGCDLWVEVTKIPAIQR